MSRTSAQQVLSRMESCTVWCSAKQMWLDALPHNLEDQALLQCKPTNRKLAQKLFVYQACAGAELNPICLLQCKLSAAVAECIIAWVGRTRSAIAPPSTKQETCPDVVCMSGFCRSRASTHPDLLAAMQAISSSRAGA